MKSKVMRKKPMSVVVVRPRVTSSSSALNERREKLQADYKWLLESKKVLSHDPKFVNKYVAVRQGKVVFAEKDIDSLMRKIKASGQNSDSFAIDFVSQKPTCFLL